MPMSPLGLLQLAASNQPVSAAQVAAAVDSPRERGQLREAILEVATLRRTGANRDARRLAAELAVEFVVRDEEPEFITDPGELADAVTGVRPAPPADVDPEPTDPAGLAAAILDRRQ
jgi:hypothetical protein